MAVNIVVPSLIISSKIDLLTVQNKWCGRKTSAKNAHAHTHRALKNRSFIVIFAKM